ARFPDEPGATIAFPVVQTCGTMERAWTDDGSEMAAPTVTLNERFGPRDILDLRDAVVQLRSEVDGLIEQLGDVNVGNLRSRVSDTESGLTDIVDRLDALDEQLGQMADQSQEQ
ncbi:MAG TPA: hypothetical protein VK987_01635, partial [Anaerolineae bacterium]|nr:hypothetical protein [Anaerolineae bacterium]